MKRPSRIRTLVLRLRAGSRHSYYDDWEDAFIGHPAFDAAPVDIRPERNLTRIRKNIGEYDLVVLLHSTNADSMRDLGGYAGVLCERRGKLLALVGNEVNLPGVSMVEKIAFLRRVEADFIGTQLPLDAGEWLYAECNSSRVVPLPHALNPASFRPVVPRDRREIDIGVRSFAYYPFLGDDERNRLLRFFSTHLFEPPLSIDIRTDVRLTRAGWANFLNRCKGTVSTEAGSYFLERDDRTVEAIRDFLAEKNEGEGGYTVPKGSIVEKAWYSIPPSLRKVLKRTLVSAGIRNESTMAATASFREIEERFFRDRSRPPVHTKAISSRHFDAVGTKTCQILVRGMYNGILRPDEHYIPLENDLSNVKEAVSRFQDTSFRCAMVDRTYEYVVQEHTYRNRMAEIQRWIEAG